MERLSVSRLLDGAGCVFVALAVILFSTQDTFTPPIEPGVSGAVSSAAGNILRFALEWSCAIFGGLLFLGRPLLWLRWWKSWIAFIVVGVFLLIVALNSMIPFFEANPSLRMHIDIATDLIGFSS